MAEVPTRPFRIPFAAVFTRLQIVSAKRFRLRAFTTFSTLPLFFFWRCKTSAVLAAVHLRAAGALPQRRAEREREQSLLKTAEKTVTLLFLRLAEALSLSVSCAMPF